MKLRLNQFCNLATSPSFQAWLYNIDVEIYRAFQQNMRSARGCADNRDIMAETLHLLKESGKQTQLFDFLKANYPNVLGKVNVGHTQQGQVFPKFNPNILTYPRRKILKDDGSGLKRKVNNFIIDKIKSDYIIVGNTAYIEYLCEEDRHLIDQISPNSWLVSQFRLKNQI